MFFKNKISELLDPDNNNNVLSFTRHFSQPIIFYPLLRSSFTKIMRHYFDQYFKKQSEYRSIVFSDEVYKYLTDPKSKLVEVL